MAFFFSYSRHICNCWLKIVNYWGKRDNRAMWAGKEIKSGSELVRMETEITNVYMEKSPDQWAINIIPSQISVKSGLSQNMGFCHLKISLA